MCPQIPCSTPSLTLFGVGFNPRSNDFKVIRVFKVLHYSLSPTTYKVDVYSVRNGSWRQLHADLDNMTTAYVNE